MELVNSHKGVLTDFTKLNVILEHINSKKQFFEQKLDIIWVSTIWVFILSAEGHLHIERLSLGHVGVPISQNPEILHCLDIWADSFLKVIFGGSLIREEIILYEMLLRASHHWRPINALYAVIPLPNLDLEPEIFIQMLQIKPWIP